MKTVSNAEYEANEARQLSRQLDGVENAPLNDRREARESFRAAMADEPQIVAERIGWLINGSYGYGACRKAKQILDMGKNANKAAQLNILAAALEWSCPAVFAVQAWKLLTVEQRAALDAAITAEITGAECAIA